MTDHTEERYADCADCDSRACRGKGGEFPPFCMTRRMEKSILSEAMPEYEREDVKRIMQNASLIEKRGYGKWNRVRETIEFAHRMGYRTIGIATCVGLVSESHILADLLRHYGFRVVCISCKAGMRLKTSVGIAEECNAVGKYMCNPVMQAKLLNKYKTELNIVMGLCVGHDVLFNRYSDAPVTTLVAKDRVTGHNPVAGLYTAGFYNRGLYDITFDDDTAGKEPAGE